jgi:hypothetical protein
LVVFSRANAAKDLRVSDKALPRNAFEPPFGVHGDLPGFLLDLGRQLRAGKAVTASDLVEVGDRAVACHGHSGALALGVSVISVNEGAIFKEFEGQRERPMFCPPASLPT